MIIAVLLKIAQDNAYIGFGLYLLMYVSFMIYTMNMIDCDELNRAQADDTDVKKLKKPIY
jgi:hypothetical protein